MSDWMISVIEQYGYIGIAFMIFIENVFPPIPSEVVLLFGGFFAVKTNLSITLVIVASTVGAILGAVLLYGHGLLFDVEQIEKWTKKYGKWLRLDLNAQSRRTQHMGPPIHSSFFSSGKTFVRVFSVFSAKYSEKRNRMIPTMADTKI